MVCTCVYVIFVYIYILNVYYSVLIGNLNKNDHGLKETKI